MFLIGLILVLGLTAAVTSFIGWLCALFCAAVFGYVQPWWVFAIGWFLLINVIRMIRGDK